MRAFSSLVTIGRVVKPQGRKGEVLVHPLTDRPDRFGTLRRGYLPAPADGSREVAVSNCWAHKGRYVLKIDGVDTIDQAEALRGLDLRIGEEDLGALPEGSYYHHQLLGLRVEEASGQPLGRASEIVDTGAGAQVLVVKGPSGEVLLPLTCEFVKAVDLAGGRIVASPPELIDARD